MKECLNSKEKVLLEYICTHYKNTLEVKFRIPMNDYTRIGVTNSDELCKLLMALSIRDYISFNPNKESHLIYTQDITLTEKALNIFNAENMEE